ncbi:hypothetical protein G647_02629 [Cladophialophora carrionii CBS 160.54]|uniref:DUF1680 domain protein n=1 Tax=Cladophialophora carrionii CBS 160.54 TaxID=1279043 RepID=V9DIU4_9EURO|nr:uncharacterized protein G647_02629 [Cladophialophora carrionii CBS 160.54]ETI25852.1 hypothetical protein G647_02629 [Cladophialophora carrionii CBS 160.54]
MPLRPVPIENVSITSPFWAQLQDRAGQVTIPAIIEAQKSADHWQCLTWKEGHPVKPHPFWDSDIYKVTEAACYYLLRHPEDEALRAEVEAAVDMISAAQHPDGYINSYYTVRGIGQRWTNLRDMHELYCLGHLVEATVAYESLTRSGRLLAVATKAIQHIDSIFGPESAKKQGYPGHQEIELALLRLHEMTHDPLPLKLARYFILERGRHYEDDGGDNHTPKGDAAEIYFDREARARGADPYEHMGSEHKPWYHEPRDYAYQQADRPLAEQTQLRGHAVRAMYYLTGATDLVRVIGDQDPAVRKVQPALSRLWRDLVDSKLYITGGIGSVTQWEGFGDAYALPDLESQGCYAETCATFALIHWCHRLVHLRDAELRSEYADVMETCLYNAFLGAVNTQGDAFYYQNVLRTVRDQPKERSKWFGVACCPPNVAKLLGSLGSLIYSTSVSTDTAADGTTPAPKETHLAVAIHLYIASEVTIPGTDVTIRQTTNMPWCGDVAITITGTAAAAAPVGLGLTLALALRIPSWASQPGRFDCSAHGEVRDGYLHIAVPVAPHDGFSADVGANPDAHSVTTIRLSLGVAPRIMYANPLTGKDELCLARGPLIYCIEDVDNANTDVDVLALEDSPVREGPEMEIAGVEGVVPLIASGRQLALAQWERESGDHGQGQGRHGLYGSQPWRYEDRVRDVVVVPYFLRANRGGNGAMRVWTKRMPSGRKTAEEG